MEYIEQLLNKIGEIISIIVGNIAQFFLGPLPRFLLRLGVPYAILLGLTLVSSITFKLIGFTTMVPPLSAIIAMAIVGVLLFVAFIFKKGGQRYDNDERPVDSNQFVNNGTYQDVSTYEEQYSQDYLK